ncbi:hypothetical protein QAD02_009719 [Eretmocerus hayati]|uniref:Uncharacterized protein n=1 Tax=Eretmocerus hayati TaxID=131215 RepID=A0ACC2NAX6_9HYME|nr:hypothetical protein QAD02_009719 [Eretmocerus hayati]
MIFYSNYEGYNSSVSYENFAEPPAIDPHSPLSSVRIVNGQDATKGEFPFIVSLQNPNSHICGGSIINEYWILTAAHCLNYRDPDDMRVKVGKLELKKVEDSEQEILPAAFFIHEKYSEDNSFDIGLIKLQKPIVFNDLVQPIELPTAEIDVETPVTLTGWGLIEPSGIETVNILQKAELPIITIEECKEVLDKLGKYFPLQSYHLCTGNISGVSGASGDSGSPLVKKADNHSQIVGIAVWAIYPYGVSRAPTGYMKVSSFIDWIESTMNKNH